MSHAIVSLDGKNGILKSSDARPSWTLTSILAYIGIFGYSAFLDEYKRIESLGGACEGFYYMSDEIFREHHFIQMLSSKELGFNCQEMGFTGGMRDTDYGYHVTENEIKTYRKGKLYDTFLYDEKELRKDVIVGVLEGDIRKILRGNYHTFDDAND